MAILFFSDADPSNYMSYYKRATVFLALSRPRPALSDLDKVCGPSIGGRTGSPFFRRLVREVFRCGVQENG